MIKFSLFSFLLLVAGHSPALPLEKINLPPGFKIEVYADSVENARQMALGDDGTLYVGSRRAGNVYALRDTDGDGRIDKRYLIAKNLYMPSGLVFRDGHLYVGAVNRILRFPNIGDRLEHPSMEVLTDQLPDKRHHGWKYLGFGPDGWLYIPVGAPCNTCDEPGFAQIRRFNIETGKMEVWARGVRNSVGMDWHPKTGELWFTDNGSDMMGDDIPADELNHAPRAGMHFGYPYCHQGDILDKKYGAGKSCSDYTPPAWKFGAHVATLGMKFYTGNQFPAEYQGKLFVAEHGSWNRSSKVGYRVVTLDVDEQGNVSNFQVFASGWLQGEKDWGRPNDVLVMPDGSLLISDDKANAIYRVTYTGKPEKKPATATDQGKKTLH